MSIMQCGKAILLVLVLVLSFTTKDVSAGCTVVDRFIGVDSGEFIGMSFKYDLTVQNGTTQADIRTAILPAIEKALAEKVAPFMIPSCAASGTDTSDFPDVVGLDLDPKDTIAGACVTNVTNCYTINGKVSLYVSSTAKNVASYFNYATAYVLVTLKTGSYVDNVIVSLGNFKSVQTPPPSPSPPTSAVVSRRPTKAPTIWRTTARPTPTDEPTSAPSKGTLLQKAKGLEQSNPTAFYGGIGVIVLIVVVIITLIVVCCSRGKQSL
jgi:hypothetical protein